MIIEEKMLLLLMILGSALSAPTDEFKEFTRNVVGDFLQKSDKSNIVPSGFISSNQQSQYISTEEREWAELNKLIANNKYFSQFKSHVEKGTTTKDLTFCIYDDNMREAVIALFRLFQTTEEETFEKVKKWAKDNVNNEMYMYALRLESIYSSKTNQNTILPPFIWNPHYFVNSESLSKASLVKEIMEFEQREDEQMSKIVLKSYGSSRKSFVIISSNYSGWNMPNSGREDNLNYFREDVSLNSYYLGIHLLHPFWMSNEELEFYNPKFAEHYYYAHQQLVARYNLEKLHIRNDNASFSSNGWDYIPYLRHKNGLSFPTRSCIKGDWDTEKAYLKTIDIAIRECISRGLLIMQNGTMLSMTDDSHIDTLAKLIRANLDGIKVAKIARSIVGYGGNKFPINEYNPAPSILHHPETTLRDPAYWFMLQHMLNYFTDYKNTMEPFDLSQYESDEFEIVDNDFSKLTTYFDYYKFSVNMAMSYRIRDKDEWPSNVAVRQRRLTRVEFTLNFTVESTVIRDTIVRLYLGPECSINCWDQYNTFFELDTFRFTLQEGLNLISWCPENSEKLSFDDDYNHVLPKAGSTKYSIFKFPANLLIPRGLEEGLNLTLFIMITPADDDMIPYPPSFYREVSSELDTKPLGFPFHRQAKNFLETALNYKFYNITIYHKSRPVDYSYAYFSPYLY